ncbi:MAG: chromate transporter [Oscillospiraceae bacterium]|nr:chromate transporter [Oscillospiraceae bacterium]
MSNISLWTIFRINFIIGLVTFGGGLSMVSQMYKTFVDKKGWLTGADMADYMAISQSLPGAIVINMSILIGYKLRGWRGGLIAALSASLPSLLVLGLLTLAYEAFSSIPMVLGALRGIRAATAALLFSIAWQLKKDSFSGKLSVVIFACALGAVLAGIHPIQIILGGVLLGIVTALLSASKTMGRTDKWK